MTSLTKQQQEMVRDRIYEILFDNSRLSHGVRCVNEDEWPVEELKQFLLDQVTKTEERAMHTYATKGYEDMNIGAELERVRILEILEGMRREYKKEASIAVQQDDDYLEGFYLEKAQVITKAQEAIKK